VSVNGIRLVIDLGTSNTVAVLELPDGSPRPVLFDGSEVLPSAVCVSPGGDLLVGRDALHAARSHPAGFEPYPKRRVDEGSVLLDRLGNPVEVPVVDLFAAVLGRVSAEATLVAGARPDLVTLSCPAGWGAPRRGVLLDAARAAGLGTPALVDEPVAAAAHFVDATGVRLPVGACAVVYDLGAGTFDASVVRRTVDGFVVLATTGLTDVGGLDLDAAIVAHLRAAHPGGDPAAWQRLNQPDSTDDRRLARAFWEDVRSGKEMLSRTGSTVIHIPILDIDAPLDRAEFERLARPVVARTVAAVASALGRAGLDAAGPTGLFLVGGSSRVPLVATMLRERFGRQPYAVDQPELVVARGSLRSRSGSRAAPMPPAAAPQDPTPRPEAAPSATPSTTAEPTATPTTAAEPTATPTTAAEPSATPTTTTRPAAMAARRRSAVAVFAAALVLAVSAGVIWANRPGNVPAVGPSPTPALRTVIETGSAVHGLAFGPDGRSVATAGGNDHIARIWDCVTGELVTVLPGDSVVSAVAFSPDGSLLATDSTIWTVATATRSHSLDGSHYGVAFNRQGTLLAVAGGYSVNEGVRLFDPATGRLVRELTDDYASAVAFSPDGRTLAAAAGYRGTLVQFDVATGKRLQSYAGGGGAPAFSPDGRLVASAGPSALVVWEAATARPVLSLTGGGGLDLPVFSPDGRLLGTAGNDLTVRLWEVRSGALVTEFPGHTDRVTGLAFSPDGAHLASAGTDRTVRLWPVPPA
jgi:roadblock/LC7 domain-containing protein